MRTFESLKQIEQRQNGDVQVHRISRSNGIPNANERIKIGEQEFTVHGCKPLLDNRDCVDITVRRA